jgi:hypothetical protein
MFTFNTKYNEKNSARTSIDTQVLSLEGPQLILLCK